MRRRRTMFNSVESLFSITPLPVDAAAVARGVEHLGGGSLRTSTRPEISITCLQGEC